MGHSKSPWKVYNFDGVPAIEDADGRHLAKMSGIWSPEEDRDNAEYIAKACIEHDTLKAKADLFDKAITIIRSQCAFCVKMTPSMDKCPDGCRVKRFKKKVKDLK